MKEHWPKPKEVGIFKEISNYKDFNKIIGNPKNWNTILSNKELLDNWIIPNAILLFGKYWFDNTKWKNRIGKGIPFSLFTIDDKKNATKNNESLEETTKGRSIIFKINLKVEKSLNTYLKGEWYDGILKSPGGYIVNSIKNSLVREIGKDLGFKYKSVPVCPYCLGVKNIKTVLKYHGSKIYSCDRCEELYINSQNNNVKIFKNFIGITCICPNNKCLGKFVPLNAVDSSLNWDKYKTDLFKKKMNKLRDNDIKSIISKNIVSFYIPSIEMEDLKLICPYCETKFTPKTALKLKSGYKNHSGYLSGLPHVSIWEKGANVTLDDKYNKSYKDNLVDLSNYNYNNHDQKIQLLKNEIIIKMSRLNKNKFNDLLNWFFYYAVILWMKKYKLDSLNYLFNQSNFIRGKEASIHYSLFNTWMNVLEKNIHKFNKFNLKKLEDFNWFAHYPKFSGGPKSIFSATIDCKNVIRNNTNIVELNSKFKPRIAKIYSIMKNNCNYLKDIESSNWNNIKIINNSIIKPGDEVIINCLIMSGHPTHAPFQRMIRFRKNCLKNIIDKINIEEKTGEKDFGFWKLWDKKVVIAKKKIRESMNS